MRNISHQVMCYRLRMRSGHKAVLIAFALCAFIGAAIWALEKTAQPVQQFTGYPPSVYMQFFLACSPDKPCTRTDEFRVDSLPKACCTLLLTNGDGRGTDEVSAFEVTLNGERVLPEGNSRYAHATVSVRATNSIKVILTGKPDAKVFVLIAYDPSR